MSFSKDFVWGVATAAYQIEGAAYEDFKGLSIWDTFTHTKGKIFEEQNADVACDHYHRVDEDIALMVKLGIKAYRFSISWARIIPNGIGEISQKGIDFYNNLIDKLVENDITPYITLYHWDLPLALHAKGGWLNPEIADWFAEYSKVVAINFSDRVKSFITINEPQVFSNHGYRIGVHAPGYKLPDRDVLCVCHNILRAHGASVKALRENSKSDLNIGISIATGPIMPVDDTPKALKDANEIACNPNLERSYFSDVLWLDPIFFGKYPDSIALKYKDIMPKITNEDMKLISQPIDFIGTNIYQGRKMFLDDNKIVKSEQNKIGQSKTAINWKVTPEALYFGPKFLYDRYKKPIYITENGMSAHDVISLDGKVHDPNRQDFMHRYLLELKRASEDGVDIAGYFPWTLMDNFEWAEGYNERFGMVYVDFESQKRIIKDSAYWYKEVINTNGENL